MQWLRTEKGAQVRSLIFERPIRGSTWLAQACDDGDAISASPDRFIPLQAGVMHLHGSFPALLSAMKLRLHFQPRFYSIQTDFNHSLLQTGYFEKGPRRVQRLYQHSGPMRRSVDICFRTARKIHGNHRECYKNCCGYSREEGDMFR